MASALQAVVSPAVPTTTAVATTHARFALSTTAPVRRYGSHHMSSYTVMEWLFQKEGCYGVTGHVADNSQFQACGGTCKYDSQCGSSCPDCKQGVCTAPASCNETCNANADCYSGGACPDCVNSTCTYYEGCNQVIANGTCYELTECDYEYCFVRTSSFCSRTAQEQTACAATHSADL